MNGWKRTGLFFSLIPRPLLVSATSELTKLAVGESDFVSRSVKLIGVGADPVSRQMALAAEI